MYEMSCDKFIVIVFRDPPLSKLRNVNQSINL